MKPSVLTRRGLTFYWRTNAAVVVGVATAVAVLSGALLVGDSVRGSLRDLVLLRLGRTDQVVASTGFFREQLAQDLQTHPDFSSFFDDISPMVMTQGFLTQQTGSGRVGPVRVYGVDDRFWQFHGVEGVRGPENRNALLSPALAEELEAVEGDTILIRVQRPGDVPLESVYGRKEDLGRTLRARVEAVVPPESLGEFSLEAQQGEVRAVFLPLGLVQEDLEINGRVNTLLVSAHTDDVTDRTVGLEAILRSEARLEDLGLETRTLEEPNAVVLEADDGLLDDAVVTAALDTAANMGLEPQPVFTYLANSLESGERQIPYSLVTAVDLSRFARSVSLPPDSETPPIVFNEWAVQDLNAAIGDPVVMEYYLWEEPGLLLTRTMEFRLAGVVPIDAGDRDLAPDYPGISDSLTFADWDPPFPIDLGRIRPIDEEYWALYRTTPKAYIPFGVGQGLWQSRYGSMTSIRLRIAPDQAIEAVRTEFGQRLRTDIDPLAAGLGVRSVRSEGLEASRGAVNFGEYFVYFSFFLVVSALLLAALFFKLSVEQRAREVGLLRAVGFKPSAVRWLFMREGLWLSLAGAVIGILGGIAYAYLIVAALGTWWVDAVGTRALGLHISPVSIAGGAFGAIAAAMVCIWVTLRSLAKVSERGLLTGHLEAETSGVHRGRSILMAAISFAGIGVALIGAAAAGLVADAGGFFGAGTALLVAFLCLFVFWFGRPVRKVLGPDGWWPVSRLGLRSVTYRPARSMLSIAMIASATFILISVDAFRRDSIENTGPQSGIGGYSLLVKSLLPLVNDPNSPEGRQMLGLAEFDDVAIEPFRLRPGDDTSCLNLYEPQNPRIIAPKDTFIDQGRFAFQDSLASNDAERANPWLLLRRDEPDGAVPVIADAHSITYVLHRKLGEDIVIHNGNRTIRLRVVAALDDSIFQSELLMAEENFVDLFPEQEGYSYLLVESGSAAMIDVATTIEDTLVDFGAEAIPTTEHLAEFHRVENTYLSTFQALGGLGLLLGTVGLGAVLLRNVLERRRELALLRALGYKQSHFFAMVIAENTLLLLSGLLTGVVCALLSIVPALMDGGGRLPGGFLLVLLCGVLAAGLITSVVATAAALRSPLLSALRAE